MARPNQQLLAERLNLSQTTVSRALANHPAINADTKVQVWDLAAKLGYQISPTRPRANTAGAEPNVIGVLIAIPKSKRGQAETSQAILRGIAERSSNNLATLDVLYHEPSDEDAKGLQRRIRQNRWKGCILVHPLHRPLVHSLAHTVPCVSVVENYRRNYIDSIDVDQINAFSFLVKKLKEAGHRKIGFATWVYDVEAPWVYHRFGAYVETLVKLGLEFDPSRAINLRPEERLTAEETTDEVAAAIRAGTTAFVCAADHQAYGLCEMLEKRGIRVPEECSITGFDGIEPPPGQKAIATVGVPYDEIGRSAFHQLLRRIEFPTAPRRHVLIDGEFIPGFSLVPPPAPVSTSTPGNKVKV